MLTYVMSLRSAGLNDNLGIAALVLGAVLGRDGKYIQMAIRITALHANSKTSSHTIIVLIIGACLIYATIDHRKTLSAS